MIVNRFAHGTHPLMRASMYRVHRFGLAAGGNNKKAKVVSPTIKDPLDGSNTNRGFEDALKLLRAHAVARFNETVECHFKLAVDPRKANQIVRVNTRLPHGTGQVVRVAVFADGTKADEAREAGADVVGSDDLVASIQDGKINFDRCIATPNMMGMVGKVARILGPRQLMPNPKHGTVTMDVKTAVGDAKAGQVNFKVDKMGVLHTYFGKIDFGDAELRGNFVALLDAVMKAKPDVIKTKYLTGATFCTTQGPGIRADPNKLQKLIESRS